MQTFFGNSWNILGGKEESVQDDAQGEGEALEHQDTAYTNLPLRPHTDGTYFTHPPAYVHPSFFDVLLAVVVAVVGHGQS